MAERLRPSRLSARDVLRVGVAGLRARPLRVFLSALGIAIGIAAMIAVVGISTSSRADLDRQLAALGTNLLTVGPGQSLFGQPTHLPDEAIGMIGRIGPVTSTTATGKVMNAKVYRNDRVPTGQSGGIAVLASRTDLPGTVGATVASGAFLNAANDRYPAVVLGRTTADRLGVGAAGPEQRIYLGGQWFTVVGVLNPVPLAPELDTAALVGWPLAEQQLGFDGYATTVYTRAREDSVSAVQSVLAATANPENPNEVSVSRPSDALAAKQATDQTLNGLLLGLGAVALLVGGVGVANTMVISVLERRAEIGLRRSLGATRGQVRAQFLAESLLLSALGGLGGVLLGVVVTMSYAAYQDWPSVVPAWASGGGVLATSVIGVIAGLYPAIRASRLAPTEALATP
ncbi:ABC transporter permease [Actinocrispum wychmicini]|uniref:Putative ABC transport system permease protein n=1 Tax=Actinocrispum wychmicini TaxID=1213861 RepID=A0A4R2JIU6_9PSEU|nr:ABC transporter permease [Actinocrispum wychmicini]TCO56926.1 putative ABC transport system permease protein [Actinocrispum wychmicini]